MLKVDIQRRKSATFNRKNVYTSGEKYSEVNSYLARRASSGKGMSLMVRDCICSSGTRTLYVEEAIMH